MRIERFFNNLYLIIGVPWLFLVLSTSGSLTAVKTILLGVLMIICSIEIICRTLPMNTRYLQYIVALIVFCTLSLMCGITGGYEFDITLDYPLIQYFLITPICILFFVTCFGFSKKRRDGLWSTLKYLTLILVIIDTLRIYLFISGIPASVLEFIEMGSGKMSEELTLRVKNESSLFFLLPIYIYTFINSRNKSERKIYGCIAVFGILYAVLSGRKMLELEILMTIMFAFVYRKNIRILIRKNLKKILLGIGILIVGIPLILSYLSDLTGVEDIGELMVRTVVDGLSSNSHGMSKRVDNTLALIKLWESSPIIGNGLNSYSVDSIASVTTRWSYEVFFVAWLAQTGLIGVGLLLLPIVYIIKRLDYLGRKWKEPRYLGLMIGFICFAIAGASNPLFYFVWPWSIALIYCNDSDKQYAVIRELSR